MVEAWSAFRSYHEVADEEISQQKWIWSKHYFCKISRAFCTSCAALLV